MSTILCFSNIDWSFLRYRKQHLMERLSRKSHVVYVNPPRLIKARAPQAWNKMERINANLSVYHPPVLPYSGSIETVKNAGRRWIVRRLREYLRATASPPVILWCYAPHAVAFCGRFDEHLRVYDMADDYTSPIDLSIQTERDTRELALLTRLEQEMFQKVDVVLGVSKALAEKKAGFFPRIHVVPNGCDSSAYAALTDEEPSDLVPLPHPRLAYVGAVWPRTDLTLLAMVADAFQSGSLVVIGPILAGLDVSDLLRRPNVKWLGIKRYDELPSYLSHLDVGLLPYKACEPIRCSSPLKLWDFLAAGIPVVSVPIPQVEELAGSLLKIGSGTDFVEGVRAALLDDCPSAREARRLFAKDHDWGRRAEDVERILSTALEERGMQLGTFILS